MSQTTRHLSRFRQRIVGEVASRYHHTRAPTRSTSGIDEETVSKTAAPRIGVQSATVSAIAHHFSRGAHLAWPQERQFSGAPPIHSSLCSSTAEHSPDKRETVERHHAEGPFPFFAGWLRQMSGGLKTRRGWRATNSSGHFHRGIDVTVTCESSKLITSGQHRHAAPI